jgi:hypothetical protein
MLATCQSEHFATLQFKKKLQTLYTVKEARGKVSFDSQNDK